MFLKLIKINNMIFLHIYKCDVWYKNDKNNKHIDDTRCVSSHNLLELQKFTEWINILIVITHLQKHLRSEITRRNWMKGVMYINLNINLTNVSGIIIKKYLGWSYKSSLFIVIFLYWCCLTLKFLSWFTKAFSLMITCLAVLFFVLIFCIYVV